jgi:sigma-B regulation protein RsbU (phosphoserine phosphatase)
VHEATGVRVISLDRETITIGRADENDVRILEAYVSKRHAEIRRDGGRFLLVDVGSKAGVLCNGRKIERCVLQSGDRIMLGSSSSTPILFRSGGAVAQNSASSLLSSVAKLGRKNSLDQLARFLEFNRVLSSNLSPAEVVESVVDLAVEMTGADRGMVVMPGKDGNFEFKAIRERAGAPAADAAPSISESTVRKVLETKTPRVVEDTNRDASLAVAQSVMSLHLGSVVAIPLWRHVVAGEVGIASPESTATDEVFGVLYLDSRERRDAFGDLDVGILETLARDASSAIENARLAGEAEQKRVMEAELARAKEVQAALMPEEYWSEPYFDVSGSLVPCLELGGDYLGQFRLADGRVAFVVADVCGKGVQAALLAAALQGAMVMAIDSGGTLTQVVTQANRVVSQLAPMGMFISMVACSLDRDGELRYVNAGHCPIMLMRADSTEQLVTGGMALGLDSSTEFEERHLQLNSGDAVMLYTDGVLEALSEDGELFGEERLEEALAGMHGRAAGEIGSKLLAVLEEFCVDAETADDTTVLTAVYRGE